MKHEIMIQLYSTKDVLQVVALVNDGWTIYLVQSSEEPYTPSKIFLQKNH